MDAVLKSGSSQVDLSGGTWSPTRPGHIHIHMHIHMHIHVIMHRNSVVGISVKIFLVVN